MIYFPRNARIAEKRLEEEPILLQGFAKGLNTAVPAFQLDATEMAECKDLKINKAGQLETRKAVIVYTTVAISGHSVMTIVATIAGTNRTIIAGSDYKIYYLNGTVPTLIGTAVGTPYLIPYNDVCLVCDGSYLKYVASTTALKIAYDAGTGGTQYNNYSGTDDSGIAIGNGTNVRAAVKFTSATWDAGFTMPLTQVSVFLQGVSSPTGTITFKLRLVSDDSILASKVCGQSAAEISDDGEFVDVYFSAADITTEMSSNTAYYLSIEYSGGDASNYISLRCSSTGTTTNPAYAYGATWANDTGKHPIMRIHPGLPPKTSSGWVSKLRPWLAGDPTNPGYVWYGFLTYLDFSTVGGGGYVSVVDEDNNSFAVGAGEDLYGDMFVYGTEDQPYLCQLTGTEPADFALPLKFQRAWATQKTLLNVGNDLWNSTATGVDALTGVQQYGDIRSTSISARVKDRFKNYWTTSKVFAGYYPEDSQYWLCFDHADTSSLLIGHVNQGFEDGGIVSYPWSEYDLPVTPKSLGSSTVGHMIGASDGYLYVLSSTEHKDLGTTQILPSFKTAYIEMPFKSVDLIQFQAMMSSEGGLSTLIQFYKNGSLSDYTFSKTFTTSMSDELIINELLFDIDDWEGTINVESSPMFFNLNINARRFQIGFKDIINKGYPVFINGCIILYRKLKGL